MHYLSMKALLQTFYAQSFFRRRLECGIALENSDKISWVDGKLWSISSAFRQYNLTKKSVRREKLSATGGAGCLPGHV